jgi:hypothetical protein
MLTASFSGKPPAVVRNVSATTGLNSVSVLYDALCLKEKGLSKKAFELAYKGYRKLLSKGKLSNTRYLTICDMGQSSRKKRLYVIDMVNNVLTINTWVAHGRNSGVEYATRFSNKMSSKQSSLGFYITMSTYNGQHGLSLRVKGLEPGFNDKAIVRGLVVHGADYIGDGQYEQHTIMGRSYGCPAVPRSESLQLINTIKEGTCLFIYHPTTTYLRRSKILNG